MLLIILLCALLCAFPALADEAAPPGMTAADETGAIVCAYTPPSNGDYGFYLFGADPSAARIRVDGALLFAPGEGVCLGTAPLVAGTEYTITVTGASGGWLEIARETRSRCFSDPLTLSAPDSYSKKIAREGDSHWYALTPEQDGVALLGASGTAPDISVFSADGQLLSRGNPITLSVSAGETLYIRVTDSVGTYTLTALTSGNAVLPDAVSPVSDTILAGGRVTISPEYTVSPDGACDLIYMESSDPEVVRVTADGLLQSGLPGEAAVTLTAAGGVSARITVRVEAQPVTGIAFSRSAVAMSVGDTAECGARVLPDSATDTGYAIVSSDESVVTIEGGSLIAVGEGSAAVTVTSNDGGFTASQQVIVQPPKQKHAALLINEEHYSDDLRREGSAESAEAVEQTLRSLSFGGIGYSVTTLNDPAPGVILAAVRETFSDLGANDVGFLYITCHGAYVSGQTVMYCADGSALSLPDLAAALRETSATVIIALDFCTSGGAIGAATELSGIAYGADSVYTGIIGLSELSDSRFYVIASACLDQSSYRVGTEDDLLTAFSRAFAEAAVPDSGADTDGDGAVSYTELTRFLKARVAAAARDWGGVTQTVCAEPEYGAMPVFERTQAE